VHVRDDVVAIDENRLGSWRPQRHVKHGTILRDVDAIAAHHCIHVASNVTRLRESDEKSQGLVGDAMLRVIDV
jgi:hypothetical protein